MTIRGDILREAAGLVEGDRNDTYGPPTEGMAHAASIFTAWTGKEFTGYEVVQVLMAIKMARIAANPRFADNAVDLAGYGGILYECALAGGA